MVIQTKRVQKCPFLVYLDLFFDFYKLYLIFLFNEAALSFFKMVIPIVLNEILEFSRTSATFEKVLKTPDLKSYVYKMSTKSVFFEALIRNAI